MNPYALNRIDGNSSQQQIKATHRKIAFHFHYRWYALNAFASWLARLFNFFSLVLILHSLLLLLLLLFLLLSVITVYAHYILLSLFHPTIIFSIEKQEDNYYYFLFSFLCCPQSTRRDITHTHTSILLVSL